MECLLFLSKVKDYKYISYKDYTNIVIHYLLMNKINIKFYGKYRKYPAIKNYSPLPVGVESEAEPFLIETEESKESLNLKLKNLSDTLPEFMKLSEFKIKDKFKNLKIVYEVFTLKPDKKFFYFKFKDRVSKIKEYNDLIELTLHYKTSPSNAKIIIQSLGEKLLENYEIKRKNIILKYE